MNVTRNGIAVAVGAVIAVLLQIVVAPNIALFGVDRRDETEAARSWPSCARRRPAR